MTKEMTGTMSSTMKKVVSLILIGIIALTMCITQTEEVSAKSVCTVVSGSTAGTTTFTVTTGKGWISGQSITLTQTKGVRYFSVLKDKQKSIYGLYWVTVKKNGGKAVTYSWTDKNIKLKLDKNSTYTITVKSKGLSDYQFRYLAKGAIGSWKTHSKWSVKKTKNITLCR